jgi:uncharacterized protein YkwD
MRHTTPVTFRKIILAGFSLIIALTIVAINPATAQARELGKLETNNVQAGVTIGRPSPVINPPAARFVSSKISREAILTNDEIEMVALINQERMEAGLKKLEIDPNLVILAREKSRDMVSHNYFGHISEILGSVYDQLKRECVSYRLVAENLAGAPDCQKAYQQISSSPAHHGNIVNPHFSRMGIGIVKGGPYGEMITQLFLN